MSGKAAKAVLTETQHAILQQIASAATSAVQHAQRAKVILEAFQGKLNEDIAAQVGLDRVQVGLWRRRWADSFAALVAKWPCQKRVAFSSSGCGVRRKFSSAQRSEGESPVSGGRGGTKASGTTGEPAQGSSGVSADSLMGSLRPT